MTDSGVAWPSQCSRVVLISPRFPEMGGGGTFISNLGRALVDVGVQVEVISLYAGRGTSSFKVSTVIKRESLHRGPTIRRQGSLLNKVVGVGKYLFKKLDRLTYMRRYRRLIEGYGRETLVIFTDVRPLDVLLASGHRRSPGGAKMIGQHHMSFASIDQYPGLKEKIVRCYAHIDAFVALSEGDAAEFRTILRVPCTAIANPIAPTTSCQSSSEIGLAGGNRLAVALARYSPEKQLDLMIRAFAAVVSEPGFPSWRLEIYGEGEERDRLERCIVEMGASQTIQLRGRTEGVGAVLTRASINLLSSRHEGTPMCVLEAAQFGVASLAFDCSNGLREMLSNLGGYLVRPADDESAYQDALREALRDDDELRARGLIALSGLGLYEPDAVLCEWASLVRIVYDECR